VNQVNSAGASGRSATNRGLAVILAIIGLLALIAGVLYVSGSANSLHFLVGSVHKGHHLIRAAVSFVVAVVLLAAAWFVGRGR
jgi:amino acid permease